MAHAVRLDREGFVVGKILCLYLIVEVVGSKELSLYNAVCSEITDNKLRRIVREVRIKKDHTIVIELKNGMLLEEAL